MKFISTFIYAVVVLFLFSAGCLSAENIRAETRMFDAEGKDVGTVTFEESEGGTVRINISLRSLPPGENAFHIHENAVCETPDFKSAGGHFNPGKKHHGFLNRRGPHAGDFPNIEVDVNGVCETSFVTDRISLKKNNRHSLFRGGGTSVVIHEKPDDYFTDPAGKGGKRVACGVILNK
jgi:superoxide dismutase, Cu-Zn family